MKTFIKYFIVCCSIISLQSFAASTISISTLSSTNDMKVQYAIVTDDGNTQSGWSTPCVSKSDGVSTLSTYNLNLVKKSSVHIIATSCNGTSGGPWDMNTHFIFDPNATTTYAFGCKVYTNDPNSGCINMQ
jgi:hypothetical protein